MLANVRLNLAQREIILKVVYYGPPLSGKTANLQQLHRMLAPDRCGRLTGLNTADDRTLFFDLLPVFMTSRAGYRIKLKLFTVPGRVVHAATRRLVLSGADGVVFVADSQVSEAKTNNDYWHGMQHYLRETDIEPKQMPTVIQFNKRDMPNVRSDADIEALRRSGSEPIYPAVAVRGQGVLETLHGLLGMLFRDLDTRYGVTGRFDITGEEFLTHMFGSPLRALSQPGVTR